MTSTINKPETLPPVSFRIREVTVDDATRLVKYLRGILKDPMASIADLDEMALDSFREREHLRKLDINENGLGIIAVPDLNHLDSENIQNSGNIREEIFGFLTLEPTRRRKIKHVVELGMSVRQDLRGRGVGKMLLEYAETWVARTNRIEKIVLNVFSDNEAALKLYKNSGYTVEGILVDQIKIQGKYQDLILMAKKFRRSKHQG
jgi:RimJ/RimL family protein N-acetyltransferase